MLKLQYDTFSHSLDEKKLFLPFSMNIKLFLMKIKIYLSVRTLFIEFFQIYFLFVFIKNCLKFIN